MKTIMTAGAVFLIFLLVSVFLFKHASKQNRHHASVVNRFQAIVKDNEHCLTNYINEVLSEQAAKVFPYDYYALPDCGTIAKYFFGATVDSNSNVYLRSKESFVTFNVGVVFSAQGMPLLGDGSEPNIVTSIFLFDSWSYYKTK